jgi:hypothetical protein
MRARSRSVLSRALLAAVVLAGPVRAATIIVPDDNPSLPDAVQSFAAIADLTGAGNTATGNGTADFRVD